MVTCFFAKFGHVSTIPLEDIKTVTTDWHVNHRLPKVFQAWCKQRPRTGVRGLLLHHDNACWHAAAVTLGILAASDVQLVNVKRQLEGKQFQNAEDARAFFEDVILGIPQSTWSGVIDSWFERMVKCVQAEGGFFQKLEWTEW